MKLRFEVDCTPEEARTFCGLPDLQPLHAAVLSRVETQMMKAVEAGMPESVQSHDGLVRPQTPSRVGRRPGHARTP